VHRWWRLRHEVRFLIAGAYNTAFGYLVFTVLFELFGHQINYVVIGCLSQAIAVVSAFLVYRRYVFGSAGSWSSSFLRFNISQLASFTFGIAALYLLVSGTGLSPVLAQAIVICASVVISYLLHRYFSFRTGDDGSLR
jgi:putative flippase GtrA